MMFESWHPPPLMNLSIAGVTPTDGVDKDAIRQSVYGRHVQIGVDTLEHYAWRIGHTDFNVSELARAKHAPASFAESYDADRLVRTALSPACPDIVVASGSACSQSKVYIQNHEPRPR